MAAGPKVWTEERIAERYAQGRGQGSLDDYDPWVRVQEFASRGNQSRTPSAILRRSIHTFSYLERNMYLWHEYLGFYDYREQVPLDRRITLGAAEGLSIRHPVYPVSHRPFVMMMDALVLRRRPDGKVYAEGWDAKPNEKLQSPRAQEKLKLHAAYCKAKRIRHQVFTEDTVAKPVLRNIEWARSGLPKEDELLPRPDLFTRVADDFQQWLQSTRHRRLVWQLGMRWDNMNRLRFGTSLRLFKFLVWHRRLKVDLTTPDLAHSHLPAQGS